MKDYVIVTDSCSDIGKEYREKYGVEYIKMIYHYDGKEYPADLDWEVHGSAKGFYDVIRGGTRIMTAQITAPVYKEAFENWIKEGKDVIYIGCSSALSASIKASRLAANELMEQYPDSKIICVDSLMACSGLFLMCKHVSKMRAEGKSIEEAEKWLEENKLNIHQECCVADLKYLKQAGRVSAGTAFFGGLFQIKPIMISDAKGQNLAIEKVKGRRQSIDRIVERMKESYRPEVFPDVIVSPADCIEDAEYLKAQVIEKVGVKEEDIIVNFIGPIIGATTGPGTMSLYFYGTEVTENKE